MVTIVCLIFWKKQTGQCLGKTSKKKGIFYFGVLNNLKGKLSTDTSFFYSNIEDSGKVVVTNLCQMRRILLLMKERSLCSNVIFEKQIWRRKIFRRPRLRLPTPKSRLQLPKYINFVHAYFFSRANTPNL